MQKSVTIVLSGEAGQGLQTLEDLLVEVISASYHVFSTSEMMSRVRGGNNSLTLRISNTKVYGFRREIDFLFLLNDHALYRMQRRMTPKTQVFDAEYFLDKKDGQEPNKSDSNAAGSVSNMSVFGFIAGMLRLDREACITLIDLRFGHKTEKILAVNQGDFETGFNRGFAFDPGFAMLKKTGIKTEKLQKSSELKILDGSSAVGIGALGGGCNFMASYPMSPGTGLLTFMANHGLEQGVLVEQAEDEIAAVNMVIGAWYAGARGMVTTSGGGFALMEEAISLSAMTETPCVIHLGQRPGPATGLPTRTEQADLNLVVYAGHGEFPRIILAPGSLEDGVLLSQKAFYLADKYQVPVFILTDQYYLDSKGQMERIILTADSLSQHIVKTDADYRRYRLTEEGISPRGIPGFGEGLVKTDSDEHDEYGMITEDFNVRIAMQDKRLNKEKLILEEDYMAELIGPPDYKHLIVGWGSTYGVLKEFIETSPRKDLAFLNVKQVFPLHPDLKRYFGQAQSVAVVENNATGQLADLLILKLGVSVTHRVLKYSGEPFSIEDIEREIGEVL